MAFSYYTAFTVQTGQVPSTQTNFPVLILVTNTRFKTVGNGGHVQNANGYDIRPYSDSGLTTALTYELVPSTYNASTGFFEMWVKVPSLANGSVIYLGYGNNAISTDGSSSGTWDTNYKGVYHLANGSTLNSNDSTSNANNGTAVNSPTAISAQVDGGATFNGLTQGINLAASLITGTNTAFTISSWVNFTTPGTFLGIVGQYLGGDPGRLIFGQLTGNIVLFVGGASFNTPLTYNDTTWHYVHVTFDTSANSIIYVDGASKVTAGMTLTTWAATNTGIGSGDTSQDFPWNGSLDEVRISNTVRSANWITTEYNNQSAPSSFYTVGTEQAIGGSTISFRKTLSSYGSGVGKRQTMGWSQ